MFLCSYGCLSFVFAGGKCVSDISNAAETRCEKGHFSKVGIEIELTLPHLFFILFVEHCDFAGRFIRDLWILL